MLFLQAGPEIAVVATKTFVTQVTTLVLLAAGRGQGPRPARPGAGAASSSRRCGRCPPQAERALVLAAPAAELARRYVNSRGFMFVGRGVTYPVALEGALKLKEVSYVHAEGYAAGELKHGPISLLDAEVPLVAVATRSALQDKLLSATSWRAAPGMPGCSWSPPRGTRRMREFADDILWVPETHRGPEPHPGHHPPPAVRLPHGRGPGHRRRPAPQPRQVGDRRVSGRAARR